MLWLPRNDKFCGSAIYIYNRSNHSHVFCIKTILKIFIWSLVKNLQWNTFINNIAGPLLKRVSIVFPCEFAKFFKTVFLSPVDDCFWWKFGSKTQEWCQWSLTAQHLSAVFWSVNLTHYKLMLSSYRPMFHYYFPWKTSENLKVFLRFRGV